MSKMINILFFILPSLLSQYKILILFVKSNSFNFNDIEYFLIQFIMEIEMLLL